MIQALMGRRIKTESRILCDFQGEGHNQIIEKGKYAYQIIGDETVESQGLYHGRQCYQAALNHYRDLKKQIEGENE